MFGKRTAFTAASAVAITLLSIGALVSFWRTLSVDTANAAAPDAVCAYNTKFTATVTKDVPHRTFRTYYHPDCTTTTIEVAASEAEIVADSRAKSSSTVPIAKGSKSIVTPNSVIYPPYGSGSGTCVAIQTLRDPVGIPETEIRNKHWFAWGGYYVNSASLTVFAVPGKTGWQVDWVTANYYGQYVPATAIQGFGNAQFVWNFQLYRHQHEANTLVYGDGRCDAEFGLTGTVPGAWSYTTHDVHWE